MRLKNKVAIITGAAHGIGYACTERYAEEGAKVVLADTDDDAGERAAEDLRNKGHEARFVRCDVGERLDVSNLMAATVRAFGRVDVLVNSAGIVGETNYLELDEAEFDRVLRVNLKGSFMAGQMAAKQMIKQIEEREEPGAIINMSSVNAIFSMPDHLPYSISKAGVGSLTKGMALALAPYGIRVNAIGPGSIMTDMLKAVATDKAAMDRLLSRTPLGRIGEPKEVAAIATFLASEDASYITGETIFADGGRLPLNYTMPARPRT